MSGAKPVSSSTFLIVPATFSWRNCRLERLTESAIRGSPRAYHVFICVHAVRSTHSPIAPISPVSSAIGMNCAGATMPYSGWFQRSRASTPASRPVLAEIIGW